jgi:hypothetical protein
LYGAASMIPPLLMVFTSIFSLRIYAMCDACSTTLSSRLLQSTHCLFVLSAEFPTSETSVTSTTGHRCTLFLKNDGQLINCAFAATSNHLVPYYSRFYIDKTDFPHPHISFVMFDLQSQVLLQQISSTLHHQLPSFTHP